MEYFSEEFNSINSKFIKFIDENELIKSKNIAIDSLENNKTFLQKSF